MLPWDEEKYITIISLQDHSHKLGGSKHLTNTWEISISVN